MLEKELEFLRDLGEEQNIIIEQTYSNRSVGYQLNAKNEIIYIRFMQYLLDKLPKSIGNLTSLEQLHLTNNKLKFLPDSLGNLRSLKISNLNSNNLNSIPSSIGNLTLLKKLNISYNQIYSLPESIGNLISLEELNLKQNHLKTLPDSLGNLQSLKILDLSNNPLVSLPETLVNLKQLEKLYLSATLLKSLPKFLGDLNTLKELHIKIFEYIPEFIENLSSLKVLYISSYSLSFLPDFIGNITSLEKLNLHLDKVTSLPESIGNLTSLKTLNLNFSRLSKFPHSLRNLSSIKKLTISHAGLTSIPEFIRNLATLKTLDLSMNLLTSLPEFIGNLTLLKKLDLSHNQLDFIPDFIGNLTSLEELNLRGNQIKLLPDSIGNLTSLKYFDLDHNKITSLPKTIKNLKPKIYKKLYQNYPSAMELNTEINIEKNKKIESEIIRAEKKLRQVYLNQSKIIKSESALSIKKKITKKELNFIKDLYKKQSIMLMETNSNEGEGYQLNNNNEIISLRIRNNKLHFLPESIGNLTHLKELTIIKSDLTLLPNTIENLTSLKILNLNRNKLISLPESMGNLTSLEKLNLSVNNLKLLPESIGNLISLEELNLIYNHLTSLPNSIGNLTSLKILNLYGNKFASIPESIGNLTSLEKLDLSFSKLTSLPYSIGNLKNLMELNLYSVNLLSLPETIMHLNPIIYRKLIKLYPTSHIINIKKELGEMKLRQSKKEEFEPIATIKNEKMKFRDELKILIQNYYKLLHFRINFNNGCMEISEENSTSSLLKYVFDRKALLNNPHAELITFNSERLTKITEDIMQKGKISKAFLSFEPDDNALVLNNFLSNEFFIKNGNITPLERCVEYIPFLVFIVKIQFSSLIPYAIIEKPLIPLVNMEAESLIKIKVNQANNNSEFNLNYFMNKLKELFHESIIDKNFLTNIMPIEGKIIDLSEKEFRNSMKSAILQINNSIENQKLKIKEKLNQRLEKELKIVQNYYEQRKIELENKKSSALEKGRKENIPDIEESLRNVKSEEKFKISEYNSIYQEDSQYELLGASLIYVPAVFYYNCEITTSYKSFNIKIHYNCLEKKIIIPTCNCGEPIQYGMVCDNLHLAHEECIYRCKECQALVCHDCSIKICRICSSVLCKDHYYQCESCVSKKEKTPNVCQEHLVQCEVCGAQLCSNCATTCKKCGKVLCKDKETCAQYCDICKEWVCNEHTQTCFYDDKNYCIDDVITCTYCQKNYSKKQMISKYRHVCKLCSLSSTHAFYEFINKSKMRIELPDFLKWDHKLHLINVSYLGKKYHVEKNQKYLEFAQNKKLSVFKLSYNYFLIYDKKNERQNLYERPHFLLRLIGRKAEEIKLNKPILIPTKRILRYRRQRCIHCHEYFDEEFIKCPYCGNNFVRSNRNDM